ncbi:MAG: DUF6263 family protein [Prevotellaceae bacterium]|jgi:hypothetical protein|nr:DUF6263 family protein [Prevotellaceae bacterium]
MKQIFNGIPPSVLVVFIVFTACSKERYNLQYKLEAGAVYKQQLKTDMLVAQNMMGQEMHIKNQTEIVLENKVQDAANSRITIESKYNFIKLVNDMGVMEMTCSSEDTTTVATLIDIAPLLRTIKNEPFTIVINQQGIIEEISGFDNITTLMKETACDEGIVKEQIIKSIEKQFGNDALKTFFECFTVIYPDYPVSVGDSWEQFFNAHFNYDMVINSKYTLKEVNDNTATINYHASINSPDEDNTIEVSGMSTKTDLNGTQTGTIHVNISTGQLIDSKMIQHLSGTMEVSQVGMKTIMEIPLKITVNIEQALLK